MSMAEWVKRDLAEIKAAACAYAEQIGRPWLLFSEQMGAALAETPDGVIWEKSGLGGPEMHGLLLFPDYSTAQDLINYRPEEFAGARPVHIRDWPVYGKPDEMTLRVAAGAYLDGAQRLSDAVQVRLLPWAVEDGAPGILLLDARLNFVAPEENLLQ
ncbi:MAG: hypothetical protein ACOY4L_01345 [Pseudomonadota bacterium]